MPAKPPEGADSSGRAGKPSAKLCPICRKPATEASKPFCSERCRDVDLNRWLSNSYAIPGKPDAGEDGE
jgi:uncharacterized protein